MMWCGDAVLGEHWQAAGADDAAHRASRAAPAWATRSGTRGSRSSTSSLLSATRAAAPSCCPAAGRLDDAGPHRGGWGISLRVVWVRVGAPFRF